MYCIEFDWCRRLTEEVSSLKAIVVENDKNKIQIEELTGQLSQTTTNFETTKGNF